MTPEQLAALLAAGNRLMNANDDSVRTIGQSMVGAAKEIVRLKAILDTRVPPPEPERLYAPGQFCKCLLGCNNGCSGKDEPEGKRLKYILTAGDGRQHRQPDGTAAGVTALVDAASRETSRIAAALWRTGKVKPR